MSEPIPVNASRRTTRGHGGTISLNSGATIQIQSWQLAFPPDGELAELPDYSEYGPSKLEEFRPTWNALPDFVKPK